MISPYGIVFVSLFVYEFVFLLLSIHRIRKIEICVCEILNTNKIYIFKKKICK